MREAPDRGVGGPSSGSAGPQTLLVHYQTEIGRSFCHLHNKTFTILLNVLALCNGDKKPMQKLIHFTVLRNLS